MMAEAIHDGRNSSQALEKPSMMADVSNHLLFWEYLSPHTGWHAPDACINHSSNSLQAPIILVSADSVKEYRLIPAG